LLVNWIYQFLVGIYILGSIKNAKYEKQNFLIYSSVTILFLMPKREYFSYFMNNNSVKNKTMKVIEYFLLVDDEIL